MTLSTIILAYQAEPLLKQAIDSVNFSDEIIVVWDTSSDNIPPNFLSHIKLIKYPLRNFSSQRNLALKKVKGDWVLFLDSDEQVSPKLAQQIQQVTQKDKGINGYFIPRQDIFYGQKLKYGETGSIKILRLARCGAGKFKRAVHETWKIRGQVEELSSPIFHYRRNLTTVFMEKMIKYSLLDAYELKKEGKPFACWRVVAYPMAKLFQNYFWRLGFLDGLLGFFHAYLMSIQSLTVRVYQWERV